MGLEGLSLLVWLNLCDVIALPSKINNALWLLFSLYHCVVGVHCQEERHQTDVRYEVYEQDTDYPEKGS